MSGMVIGAVCIVGSIHALYRWRYATLGQQVALFMIGLLGTVIYAVAALRN